MKTLICIFCVFINVQNLLAQNYQEKFAQLIGKQEDTTALRNLLEKWEKEKPNDAELYTSYFNYFFQKSRVEIMNLTADPNVNDSNSMQLTDSLGQVKGYIGSKVIFEEFYQKKAFEYIDKGISLFPKRLDMRFGKIHVLRLTKNWDVFTTEILKTIDYSHEIQNKWTWTNNLDAENPKQLFFRSIQNYIMTLYNTEDDDLLNNMREISERIVKYYPEDVPSHSNIAITYMLTGKYDKAINILKKAEKLAPSDTVILNNIAHTYVLKKDKENAILYYEKLIKHGTEEQQKYAKGKIDDLKK